MNWLIIGTGWISEDFVKSLRHNNETPLGVYSRTMDKGKLFAKKNNISNVTTSLEDLSEYDAVYIASPNAIHFNQAKKSILQNKHVMVEKPMTHSLTLTKELYELGIKHNVKVMESYAHITNDEYRYIKGSEVKTNFMQLSSAIKNGTYETASSFSEKMFGGVIPDIGVYPISASIFILGKVKSAKLVNINKELNNVIIDCEISLVHQNGTSNFRISKLVDGNNALYVDGKKILDHLSFPEKGKHRMDSEIKRFINNDNLDVYKEVSLETARVVEKLLSSI